MKKYKNLWIEVNINDKIFSSDKSKYSEINYNKTISFVKSIMTALTANELSNFRLEIANCEVFFSIELLKKSIISVKRG